MKSYKLTSVYVVTIDGIPQREVYTALGHACKSAGIDVQGASANEDNLLIQDGKVVRIIRADIVRQKRGQNIGNLRQ